MPSDTKIEIKKSRRILAVGYPGVGLPVLLKELTGSAPPQTDESLAGQSHSWSISTAYYTATVPIWLDEIVSPAGWRKDFLSPEASEVLRAIGAFVVCFQKPVDQDGFAKVKELLQCVGDVVREGCGFTWDGAVMAVAMPQSLTPHLEVSDDEWDELCGEHGCEFVDFEQGGKNQFGEHTGVARLKEALEANDWAADDDDFDIDDLDDFGDDDGRSFALETAEWEMEMRQAVGDRGEDDDKPEDDEEVERLEAMMLKMQAIKDSAADLPEAERKRFAAKAVNDMLKKM